MKTKNIVLTGLLVALQVILSRFLSINTEIVKIGFAFVPIVIMALKLGPLYACIGAAMGDFIGAFLFPIGSKTYFPGFTLSLGVMGLLFGLFLYNKKPDLIRVIICSICVNFLVTVVMNSFWIWFLSGNALSQEVMTVLIIPRILQAVIVTAVQVPIIFFIMKNLPKLIPAE